jgi:hypothetical protein
LGRLVVLMLMPVVARRHPWVDRLITVMMSVLTLVAEGFLPVVRVPEVHLPLLGPLWRTVLLLPRPRVAIDVPVKTGLLWLWGRGDYRREESEQNKHGMHCTKLFTARRMTRFLDEKSTADEKCNYVL